MPASIIPGRATPYSPDGDTPVSRFHDFTLHPAKLGKKSFDSARSCLRQCRQFVQKKVWANEPLEPAAAQRILQKWDVRVQVVRKLYSESHQVFEVLFRGERSVVKFAGTSFHWKFVLQDEVSRNVKLAGVGAPVPPILFSQIGRVRNPFFVMPYLAGLSRENWTEAAHLESWSVEANLIRSLPGIVKKSGLIVRDRATSSQDLQREIAGTDREIREAGLECDFYVPILERFRKTVDSAPWIVGQYQPPELIYDGKSFWAIDWDAFAYIHPMKWINDLTFYDYVKRPMIAERHVEYLLRALDFDPTCPTVRNELKIWQQYKAVSVGAFLVRKAGKWDYFKTLKATFLD